MNANNIHENLARKYTHSAWSGKAYSKPQTVSSLTAESKSVLARNAAIARMQAQADAFIARYANS